MPDLIIKPELGDSIQDCFQEAYLRMCLDTTNRTASFEHNGLEIIIKRKKPNDR